MPFLNKCSVGLSEKQDSKTSHLALREVAELNNEAVSFQDTIVREKRMAQKISPGQIAFVKQETQQDGRKEPGD